MKDINKLLFSARKVIALICSKPLLEVCGNVLGGMSLADIFFIFFPQELGVFLCATWYFSVGGWGSREEILFMYFFFFSLCNVIFI